MFFDFLIDVLGEEKVLYRVTEFTERLSESDRQQIADYKKDIKNKAWMLNRSNLRFVVDNGYILIPFSVDKNSLQSYYD